MTTLAIIVINYKMEDLTVSFVKKELSKITIPHKTIVVNNAATDESNAALCEGLGAILVKEVEKLDRNTDKDTFVLSSVENLGFAKGNNLGASFCKHWKDLDYILFANNDIQLLDTNTVEAMIDKMDKITDAGVIGPQVITPVGKRQSPYPDGSFWNKMVWMYWSTLFYSKEKKNKKFQLDYSQKAKEGFHYYVSGCFFMVRVSDFYRCGMFDPHTFLYGEEMILSERMKSIGKGVFFFPDVTVIHAHGVTTNKYVKNKRSDFQLDSELYYYKTYKHTSWPMLQLGRLTHWLMNIIKH